MVQMSTMVLDKYRVVEVLGPDRVGLPGIEARGRHLHHPTAGRDGQVGAGPGDEDVDHFGSGSVSLAKYAAARRRISFSIFAVRSSRRRRTSSARSSVPRPSRRPSVDVVLLHPPTQTRRGDAEIGGHLGDGLVSAPGHLDRSLAELVWIAHWHRDILPSDASRRLMFGVRQGGGSSYLGITASPVDERRLPHLSCRSTAQWLIWR